MFSVDFSKKRAASGIGLYYKQLTVLIKKRFQSTGECWVRERDSQVEEDHRGS